MSVSTTAATAPSPITRSPVSLLDKLVQAVHLEFTDELIHIDPDNPVKALQERLATTLGQERADHTRQRHVADHSTQQSRGSTDADST